MDTKIFEELPARNIKPGASPASAKNRQSNSSVGDFREKASQLASDVRYKAKKNKTTLQQEWQTEMRNSQAPMQVKILAKRMLFGKGIYEEYDVDNSVTNSVANALYKVFVEGLEEVQKDSQIFEDMDAIKYEVRVTYKDTGKTEIHLWTRDLINKKRENPNIQHIEMVGRPIIRKKRGNSLDPYNKSTGPSGDGDINNNGIPDTNRKRDPQGNYLLNRRKKIDSAIGSRNEQFDMLEAKSNKNKSRSDKEITVMRGKNNVTLFPDSKVQEETGYSKFLGIVNEKMNLAKADMGDVIKDFQTSDAPQFKGKSNKKKQEMAIAAKLEADRSVKEESECGSETDSKKKGRGEVDPRSIPTTTNLVKNKLRAMGVKNPIAMVTSEETIEDYEMLDERRREDRGKPRRPRSRAIEGLMKSDDGKGLMTRSGRTLFKHEKDRGVRKDRTSRVNPEPPVNPPAKKLAAKKAREQAQKPQHSGWDDPQYKLD